MSENPMGSGTQPDPPTHGRENLSGQELDEAQDEVRDEKRQEHNERALTRQDATDGRVEPQSSADLYKTGE